MSSFQLTIPETSLATSPGKPHTLYHILLRLPLRSFTIKKRFNDFIELHSRLTELTGAPPPRSPPAKSYFTTTVNNPSLTEERRQTLESYLLSILESKDSRWRDSTAWRSFLSLPSSWSSTASGGGAQQNGTYARGAGGPGQNGPITDPTLWLDTHRELKSLLHDARIFLSKRDQATTTGEQHESSAGAKRCLVKASTIITALDTGLRETTANKTASGWGGGGGGGGGSGGAGNDGGSGLLEGEMRRRRDLLAAARKERDGLESLANSLASKRASTTTSTASISDKNALFSNNSLNKTGRIKGGGRVLGGPIPETEATRELDNQGVLTLQKEVMKDQDQGVEELLKIVRRQKEMGIAIGEEIDLQNALLGELEIDSERVDGKMRIARKRVNKIS